MPLFILCSAAIGFGLIVSTIFSTRFREIVWQKYWVWCTESVPGLLPPVGIGERGYPEFLEIERIIMRLIEQKSMLKENVNLRRIAGAVHHANTWSEIIEALQGLQSSQLLGFELWIYGADRKNPIFASHVIYGANDQLVGWNIRLEFEGGDISGYLKLLCDHKKQSFMLDVNVLLRVLSPALSHACLVISRQSAESLLAHESQGNVYRASVG